MVAKGGAKLISNNAIKLLKYKPIKKGSYNNRIFEKRSINKTKIRSLDDMLTTKWSKLGAKIFC